MTPQKSLTELLSAFVNGTEPHFSEEINFVDLFVISYFQNILPVLAYMNNKYSLTDNEEISTKLKEILYQTVYISANRFSEFEKLSQLLSEEGIMHMPVKGWYIKELYPAPELRTFGDIDILIHQNDREKCDAFLRKNGYTVKNDWEPSYSYVKGSEFYEFHTNLIDAELSAAPELAKYFENAWNYALPDTEMRYKLSPEYHFIYVISHLAKHLYSSGAGIRMYLDIAFMLKKYGDILDFEMIYRELKCIGLGKFYEIVISCVNDWFNTSVSVEVPAADKEIRDRLLGYTLSSDLFGKTRDHSVIKLRNSEKPKMSAIIQTLFPDAETLEKRYTFIKGKKWLLPAAWVVRAVKNSNRIGKTVSNIKELSAADYNDVVDYDSFMKSLGL